MKPHSVKIVVISAMVVMAGYSLHAWQNQLSVAMNVDNVANKNLVIVQVEDVSSVPTVFFNLKIKNSDAETEIIVNSNVRMQYQ